jgi:hypothetical protein
MTGLEAVKRYIERGWAPIPIPHKSKRPVIPAWQKLRLTLHDLSNAEYFNGHEQNIGAILGEASNGLTDADLDCSEARALAPYFLPKTACIFGRESAPCSHWLYIVTPAMKTQQWQEPYDNTVHTDQDKLMLVELRGTGAQTIFPPSVHPTGEPIYFHEDGEPAVIDGPVLTRAVSRLAAACLLVRYWPAKGVRHTWALALAGGLLRGGWAEDETTHFMHAVLIVAESDNPDLHLAVVPDTAKKLAEGEAEITGWPTLSELLGARVVKKVLEWCECESVVGEVAEDVVRELNATHAVVMVGGRCVVLNEEDTSITFSRPNDFKLRYANRSVHVGKHRVDLGTHWLRSPHRRQYKQVVFAPEGAAPDCYNLWRGFAVVPKEGDCSLYLEHLEDNICSGNKGHFAYFIAWMADAIQRPADRPGVAIALLGLEGVGKGMAIQPFGRLFGRHFVHLTQGRHLLGNFNAHLKDAVLVYADEAFWAGEKSVEGVLKGLITEERHMVEFKGIDPLQVNNYTHLIISSNHDWVVPAGNSARRFAVFNVSDKRRQDHSYFARLDAQMQAGGDEALLHYLLHYDYRAVNLRCVPRTAALMEQKDLSMTPVQRFWKNCLMYGTNTGMENPMWELSVECRLLHRLYRDEAETLGMRNRSNETELGMQLKKLVPGLKKARRWYRDTWTTGSEKRRRYEWDFPDLHTCRKAFDEVMNCEHDWSVDQEEDDDPTSPT